MNKEELKNIFQFLENSEYSFDQDIINNPRDSIEARIFMVLRE